MHDGDATSRIAQILAHTGISRGFLMDTPMRRISVAGIDGLALYVRLTSYRALPLSCIAGIELSIDGRVLDLSQALIELDGAFYELGALSKLTSIFWFVLDVATLFVPHSTPLGMGPYRVVGRLATVEPYITAGRFVFYNGNTCDLNMEGAVM